MSSAILSRQDLLSISRVIYVKPDREVDAFMHSGKVIKASYHISTRSFDSVTSDSEDSPSDCLRSRSIVRHNVVMGMSLGLLSKGFLNSAPRRSMRRKLSIRNGTTTMSTSSNRLLESVMAIG